MKTLQILAVIAGLSFGVWPIVMNRSGLNGNVASIVLAAITIVCVLPFSFGKLGTLGQANWWIATAAGVIGAVGITAFNAMLSKATPVSVSTLLVLMVLAQVASTVVYQLITTGGLTVIKACGFILAAIAAVLLIKG